MAAHTFKVIMHYRTAKPLLTPGLQIRVRNRKLFLLILNRNICCGYLNGHFKRDCSLKTKNTDSNLLIMERSQFLRYESLVSLTYTAYKMHFLAKCNSGRISIL